MQLPPNGIRILATQGDHPPWPVRRARLEELHENLLPVAGIEIPGAPLVHYSKGVEVRFARGRSLA